jgi:catechol 2,3-dioxygenase-like lactoylglutathione lyase family enzyme
MIDHTAVNVTDSKRRRRSTQRLSSRSATRCCSRSRDSSATATARRRASASSSAGPVGGGHVAFSADRDRVDAFYAAATAAGGTDNGAPGVRAHYHEHYYAAFVRDADGNNIEAVCQQPA